MWHGWAVAALLIGLVFLVTLVVDMAPLPLRRLSRFPFKNLPSTNGALFALTLCGGIALLARFL